METENLLVHAGWLATHRSDPAVRVIEVDVSPSAYEQGHVDGAVLWNVYADLKDGDYRLIDTQATEALFRRSGIDAGSTVVCYGYAPALAFWLLKLYGHRDVRILNCSRTVWRDGGGAWSSRPATPAPSRYQIAEADPRLRVGMPSVQAAMGSAGCVIVDVRTASEYAGERFWPSGAMQEDGRAGHVPTALHVPIDQICDVDGAFRAVDELRDMFAVLDLTSDDEIISYCTIGGRAATAWFTLTYLLGRRNVRVYDGSWAEWGRDSRTSVA